MYFVHFVVSLEKSWPQAVWQRFGAQNRDFGVFWGDFWPENGEKRRFLVFWGLKRAFCPQISQMDTDLNLGERKNNERHEKHEREEGGQPPHAKYA